MNIWLALLIPIIVAGVGIAFFHKKLTWWELILPIGFSILIVLIFKFTTISYLTSDTEYRGGIVIKAEYYEYWDSWVHKTCSRQVSCGTDSKGNTKYCTEYYDCSYCDENPARWKVIDTRGNSFFISETYFKELSQRWNFSPKFVDLHRSIIPHFSCGTDGDMYEIYWDNKIETSDATVTEHSYENRVQAAHTSFDYIDVSIEEAKMKKLYNYPLRKGYKQNPVMGLDSVKWMTSAEKISFTKQFEYLNGKLGPDKHVKFWLLMFVDAPLETAFLQEAYWDGGNDNEVIMCMSMDRDSNNIQWVQCFSWTPNRQLLVDLREDVSSMKSVNSLQMYNKIRDDLRGGYVWKDFKEFDYVSVELPTWSIVTTFFITLLVSVGVIFWGISNEFDNDSDKFFKK